jgi:SAM-dependent methyltransferase
MPPLHQFITATGRPNPCKCVVCGHESSEPAPRELGSVRGNTRRFLNVDFHLWKCPTCQTIHSLDKVDLQDIYREYPLNQRRLDVFARGTLRNLLQRLESGGLNVTDRILDFGCGNGIFIQYLRQHRYRNVIGYDPFVPAFAGLPQLSAPYDYVVANDVIEHCDDPRILLRECVALLKPGGLLYVGTADSAGVEDMAKLETHIMRLHQPFHRVILTEQSLLALGAELGLVRVAAYLRSYMDTRMPFSNYRFLDELNKAVGDNLDLALDPAVGRVILRRPRLLFYAVFGYFFPSAFEPAVLWRKPIQNVP